MNNHNDTILSIIKSYVGEANMRTQYEITNEAIARGGVNITERQVRLILRELIANGHPILSSPLGGYYWQEKEEEGLRSYRRLRRQGIRILLRARNVLRNSRQDQQRLFDVKEVV
jgi:hypothetical protein